MLTWFRVQASRIAAAPLLSLVILGGSLANRHLDDCHDAACRSVIVAHDASAHRVSAPAPAADNHPLHCLVCHWARSFRPRPETRFLPAPAVEADVRIHVEIFTTVPAALAAQPPLRSPPASPVIA